MAKSIFASLRHALANKGFVIAVTGTVAVLLLSSVQGIFSAFRSESLMQWGYHTDFVISALSSNAMTLALPILCALPYTATVLDDIKSGFIKAYLPRTTVMRYLLGKILAYAISGALVMVIGILLAWGLAALLFLPLESAPTILVDAAGKLIEVEKAASPLPGTIFRICFSGSFWALVGMLLATLTGSKYMAYASPFVIYYVLIILYERYFDKLYIIYPKEWLNPSDKWMYGDGGVVILLFELTAIAALATGFAVKRRLSEL